MTDLSDLDPILRAAGSSDRSYVVLLTELFPPFVGGSAVLFEEIYSRLSGYQVVVLTDRDRSPGEDLVRGSMRIERQQISSNQWGVMRLSGLKNHVRVARFLNSIAHRQPSITHCGRTIPEGLAAAISRLGGGPEYCCWVHGEDLAMQLSTSRELRLLTKLVCRYSSGFFVNSEFTGGLLRQLGVPPSKTHVVHPGVDTVRFNPAVDGSEIRRRFTPEGQPLILSVGRLQRRKGFDLSIRAVAELRDKFPELRYLIVGDGDDRQYLKELISRDGLTDRVFDVGRIEDVDLPKYYAACDAFVHPNRVEGVDVEGFGLVFLEAAASGKPAIGGDSGGVPEAIAHNETGILVSGTDPQELAGALSGLLEAPERAKTLGQAGRRRVEERFTWRSVASRMQGAMEQISR